MSAKTATKGMARYLTDPPESAQQEYQGQQREAKAGRENSSQVADIASVHGKELTRLARDPEARRAQHAADRAERDRLDAERERQRVQRAKDALKHRTEIADPTARGQRRYIKVDE
ncbi:hypothetical protein R4P47_08090 [Rhodococcus sp. IEGM 1370]|uniref:hypothetical protein n=1 Tax=Rhodococcus sp. IEGM 1370 TaxID=3082222 RepID=UPI0029538FEB|nr:hypothetical protein [Rhodococcus sp. IEGM 1370]MDV8076514.1 hypothetical protein [Rhodococcus sp. IEGM 1370]